MKRKVAQMAKLPGSPWRLYLDTSVIGGYGVLTIVSPKEVNFDE